MAALQYLESLRNAQPELAKWYNSLADLYQEKLWIDVGSMDSRNKRIFEKVCFEPGDVVRCTKELRSDFSRKDANSGCGFIIWDSCGSVVLLGPCGIGVVPGIEYAEAVAIKEGIQGAIDHGLNRLVLESNCLSLISKLQLRRFWKGPLGRQLEASLRLGARVGEIRWSHVKMDGNKVAHALARLGFSQVVVNSSMSLFPGVIEQTGVVI